MRSSLFKRPKANCETGIAEAAATLLSNAQSDGGAPGPGLVQIRHSRATRSTKKTSVHPSPVKSARRRSLSGIFRGSVQTTFHGSDAEYDTNHSFVLASTRKAS